MNGDSLILTHFTWKVNANGMILLLEALVYPILKHLHEGTHYRRNALANLIKADVKGHLLLLSHPQEPERWISSLKLFTHMTRNLPGDILNEDGYFFVYALLSCWGL